MDQITLEMERFVPILYCPINTSQFVFRGEANILLLRETFNMIMKIEINKQ